MMHLIAAAAFFVAIHLFVSGTRLREALIGRISQGPYMGLFVLASFAGLGWLIWGYGMTRGAPGNVAFWGVSEPLRWVQIGLMLVALSFIVIGLSTPNPTSVRQEGALDRPDVARGMLRVTRHPFLWGVAIWGLGHLLVNGDLASLILFGSLLALALFGTASIDAKRKRALGLKWDTFAAQTSNVPFAAIADGRQQLRLGEIGWWRIGLGVLVWAVLLALHPYVFGVPALPA
ncbi:MAG TPA: NnrU family protein [Phenylobacterium sp.]|nr:NnrU family protein [Phenylobacterium sp.]